MYILKKGQKFGLESARDTLAHGNNSGYAAINLAVHLGAARIVLLGYDMGNDGKVSHFHEGYPPNATAEGKPRCPSGRARGTGGGDGDDNRQAQRITEEVDGLCPNVNRTSKQLYYLRQALFFVWRRRRRRAGQMFRPGVRLGHRPMLLFLPWREW